MWTYAAIGRKNKILLKHFQFEFIYILPHGQFDPSGPIGYKIFCIYTTKKVIKA